MPPSSFQDQQSPWRRGDRPRPVCARAPRQLPLVLRVALPFNSPLAQDRRRYRSRPRRGKSSPPLCFCFTSSSQAATASSISSPSRTRGRPCSERNHTASRISSASPRRILTCSRGSGRALVPEVIGVPAVPLASEVPGVSWVPELSEVPTPTGAVGSGEALVPSVPGVPRETQVSEVSEVPGITEVSGVPGPINDSSADSLARLVGGKAFLDIGRLTTTQLSQYRPVVLIGLSAWVVGGHGLAPGWGLS
jgi:hypothetical protein